LNDSKKNSQSFIVINHKLVNHKKERETTDKEEYTWDYYAKNWKANDEEMNGIKKLHNVILDFAKSKKWNIKPEHNKGYISMKHGSSNVCTLNIYQREIVLTTSKFNEDEKPDNENEWDYYSHDKSFYTYFDPNKIPEISKLENFLKRSYSRT